MNQVSYYIGDRLKVIKFILKNILATWWEFHFNLIPKRFYVWSWFQHWQFMEALESLWKESEWFSFSKNIVNESWSTADSFVYHFKKDADNATIKMPYFSRYERDNNWYCTSIYNFRKTMPCLLY